MEHCLDFVIISCIFLYLLLYIRKFLSKVVSVCRYLSTNWCCKILFGEKKNCNKLWFYSDFLKMGSLWPHGTVNITFFMVPKQGKIFIVCDTCQLTFIIMIGAYEVSSSKTDFYFASVKVAFFCDMLNCIFGPWNGQQFDEALN